MSKTENSKKAIKCVVWDLDDTLWQGTLLEGEVWGRREILQAIQTIDGRGILQSIASRNDYPKAMSRLQEMAIAEYFLFPQINWNNKSESIRKIAQEINIGIDAIVFIDDQEFEREEVSFALPEVLCVDPSMLEWLLGIPAMNPQFVTEDSARRREMYLLDIQRREAEESFGAAHVEFLATLDLECTIAYAGVDDLQRAEELTVRTNQLNTTGETYSYEELRSFIRDSRKKLFILSLKDRFGTYGKIGLALIHCTDDSWTIKLLLISCRVMSRGVGTIILNYLIGQANHEKVRLLAEFRSNNRNRAMYITYKFAGFQEISRQGDLILLEHRTETVFELPRYVKVTLPH